MAMLMLKVRTEQARCLAATLGLDTKPNSTAPIPLLFQPHLLGEEFWVLWFGRKHGLSSVPLPRRSGARQLAGRSSQP